MSTPTSANILADNLRAESLRVENRWTEADTALVASVGSVVERPLEGLVFCQVLCRRRPLGPLGGGRR